MPESNENTPKWALAYIEDAARITFLDEGSGTKGLRKAVKTIKTALAEAEARGYARGLEEAAKVAEAETESYDDLYGAGTVYAAICQGLTKTIRSLATTPAETQKPEEDR